MLRLFLSALVDLLAPPACLACDAPGHRAFCMACRQDIEPALARSVDGVPVIAGARYVGPVALAVRKLKYSARPDVAVPLARMIEAAAPAGSDLFRARLVPVPLHVTRLSERGYNQAALLARALAERAGGRALPLALGRSTATARQVGLERAEREANVLGAFFAREPHELAGRDVVLVDDVVTTGATARACMRALEAAGARVLGIACVASTGAATA